ncbi:MAG TPA: phosphatase PAP2 family protein, partial [Planctomycetota bacterium]|nr:phosphatase PAP2 family protein [Planctomycetota bacterium]
MMTLTESAPQDPGGVEAGRECRIAQIGVGIGLASLVALTLLFWATDLDLTLVAGIHGREAASWPLARKFPWRILHHHGAWPGLLLGAGALLGWICSLVGFARRSWRGPCLFVVLQVLMGPGLLVNGITKNLAGRPRPYETLPFGGTLPYLRPFEFGNPHQGASFLSGHASMAFLFMGLFFVVKGRPRWAALAGGLAFGLLVGTARVL